MADQGENQLAYAEAMPVLRYVGVQFDLFFGHCYRPS
jgi:hypothetical protein